MSLFLQLQYSLRKMENLDLVSQTKSSQTASTQRTYRQFRYEQNIQLFIRTTTFNPKNSTPTDTDQKKEVEFNLTSRNGSQGDLQKNISNFQTPQTRSVKFYSIPQAQHTQQSSANISQSQNNKQKRHRRFASDMLYEIQDVPEEIRVSKQKFNDKVARKIFQQYQKDQNHLIHLEGSTKEFNEQECKKYVACFHETIPDARRQLQMLSNRSQREVIFPALQFVASAALKVKNQAYQSFILYHCGKMAYKLKVPIEAVNYYKTCKRIQNGDMLYRAKCYRGLGDCFLQIRQNLALHYYTKYLQISWTINNRKHELISYDKIGLYYFYKGDLKSAKYFHDKLMNGQYESLESSQRKLGIVKYKSSLLKLIVQRNNENDDDEFAISSDEEQLPIDIPTKTESAVSKVCFSKKKIQKFQLRKEAAVVLGKSLVDKQEHVIKIEKNVECLQRFKDQCLKENVVQSTKSYKNQEDFARHHILLSHMTPNRDLQSYQHLELNKSVRNSKSWKNMFVLQNSSIDFDKIIFTLTAIIQLCRIGVQNKFRLQ